MKHLWIPLAYILAHIGIFWLYNLEPVADAKFAPYLVATLAAFCFWGNAFYAWELTRSEPNHHFRKVGWIMARMALLPPFILFFSAGFALQLSLFVLFISLPIQVIMLFGRAQLEDQVSLLWEWVLFHGLVLSAIFNPTYSLWLMLLSVFIRGWILGKRLRKWTSQQSWKSLSASNQASTSTS